jgi:hypothetical protein
MFVVDTAALLTATETPQSGDHGWLRRIITAAAASTGCCAGIKPCLDPQAAAGCRTRFGAVTQP